jgi:acyl-coenzyme A synthetase/AMP-(fatty) acid ligase
VPVGESGELCLSGSQVTSGYWNNVQKTREQFTRLPTTGETVWYRTGDVVKQDASGCLYYLGRVDHQVKIRGYRVELQEIEGVLRKATETEQVVCLPWPVNNGSADGVIAFITGVNKDQQRTMAFCRQFLPDYMVPQRIYVVDQMPVNANGKVDRLSLAKLLQAPA